MKLYSLYNVDNDVSLEVVADDICISRELYRFINADGSVVGYYPICSWTIIGIENV